MTGPDRRRLPSAEDRALWDTVSKTVKPLKRPPAAGTADTPLPSPAKKAPAAGVAKPRPATPPVEPPPLAPLDRRLKTRIGKGTVAIDARIDLHGLTQAAAHERLRSFLAKSQAAEARLVLVITGKGRRGATPTVGEERGVLRRLVPIWLASSELRQYVVGYDAAGRGHGGEGALYVRIRNPRRAGAS